MTAGTVERVRGWRGFLVKWTGRLCVYRFPGCTCTRSPEYMAWRQTLADAEETTHP